MKKIKFITAFAIACNFLFNTKVFSQGGAPISQSANSMVDLLTGDFKYGLPVMTVPGPNGESVPISFNYYGGVRMNQDASWIGLGWSYNPGEISHAVRGVSDDWKDKLVVTTTTSGTAQTTTNINFYGPLYFKNCGYSNTSKKMDIYTSLYKQDGALFSSPDYDDFNVSGPGIAGVMSPKVYSFGGYYIGDLDPYSYNTVTAFSTTKPIHFIFENDITHYSVAQEYGRYYGGANAYTSSTNRIHTQNYIEYYTNSEINTSYTTLKANGFLDYRTVGGTRRPTTEFDSDGIGAFRITTPGGMVYHYSLPVYMLENEKSISFALNSSYDIDNTKEMKEIKKTVRYAVSWKLTAITGPDYIDSNSDGIANIGDSGYWISYNYGKWIDDFNWKSPFFNYKHNLYDKRLPSNYLHPDFVQQTYENEGTVNSGQMQSYYLNSIQTATHTAYFIKEVRLDAHAVKEADNGIAPSLRLSKIVLIKNEDIPLFSATASLPCDSRFTLANTNCVANNITPHIGNYNANELLIKANSLETVELTADYSLCKYLYNNINNTFSTTSAFYNATYSTEIYKKFVHSSLPSSTDTTNSGKLTLMEVKLYGPGYMAISPSYQFSYDQSSYSENPHYSTFKADYWGYYKRDYSYDIRGRHTTEGTNGSYNHVDAWSLKKITTPLGGEILIEYESDKYEKTNYGSGYASPQRNFLIHTANLPSTAGWTINVFKEVNNFISIPGILYRKIFMPFVCDGSNSGCDPRILSGLGDSVCTLGTGFSNITFGYTTGSTTTTQIFTINKNNLAGTNYYNDYPSCNSYNNTLTYTYNPLSVVGGKIQGWGYVGLVMPYVYGGGVRVKQITMREPDVNQSYINEYTYETGAAGTEPGEISIQTGANTLGGNRNASDPHMPPPVVSYGKVTVRSKSLNNAYNGKTVYEFDNMFDPFTISAVEEDQIGESCVENIILQAEYTVKELIGALGRPLSVTDYDNNNVIVNSKTFQYRTFDLHEVPSIKETFTQQLIDNNGACGGYSLSLDYDYVKIQGKNLIKQVTTFKDGIVTTEEPIEFDPFTGQPTRVLIKDPTSGITDVQTRLAYLDYADMGAKSKNSAYENLLTATSKVSVYKDKMVRNVYDQLVGSGNYEQISGTKTTWRQSIPQRIYNTSTNKYTTQSTSITSWKPWKTYVYNGDANDANWREESDITLFNKRNQVIETKSGVSNRYSAVKMGYDQQIPLCQATDAKYNDFTFSGFEDRETGTSWETYFGGEVYHGEMRYAGDAGIVPHTGKYMAKVAAGAFGPGCFLAGFTPGRSYRASVWIHKNSVAGANLVFTLDGSTGFTYQAIDKTNSANVTVGDWILMTLTINVPANYVESGGTYSNGMSIYLWNNSASPAYFDDFMVRPVDAGVTGNVVDEKTGRTLATLDSHNFATKYVYDDAGRVKEIWVETATDGWKLQSRYTYNFKRTY